MARTKTKERAASRPADVEMGSTGGPQPPSMLTVALLGVSILAAAWAVMMMFPAGRVMYVFIFSYLEFYMGVLALVSLSITIMVGLVSTDRLVLTIRQRLLLQSTHRTTGVMAVASLGIHLWTKLAEGHITVIDFVIPFMRPGNELWVGFGTISAWIMIFTMWTGLVRARFIGRGKPWMWRAVHAFSYLMWPIAMMHGLNAGRPAAVWVIVSYVVCVVGVVIGLAVRIAVSLNRKKDFASQQGTAGGGGNAMKPVGKMPSLGGRGRGRDETALVSDRGNAIQAWKPAARPAPKETAPAPVAEAAPPAPAAAPVAAAPSAPAEERRKRRDDDYDEPTRTLSRRALAEEVRRYDEDAEVAVPRSRRRPAEVEDDFEDTRRPRSRRRAAEPLDDEPTRTLSRRAPRDEDVYDDAPAPRSRRRYADEEEDMPAPRSRRRYADEDDRYDDAPAPARRSSRYADEEPPPRRRYADDEDDMPAPRSRRDVDRADSGRHSRSEFVNLAADDEMEPDETPTLVDMAQRRARRALAGQDPAMTGTGRSARRGGGRSRSEDADDDQYWAQLRGEAR
jgi:hypothetical protein